MKRVLQTIRDGHTDERSLNRPLLDGEQGNMQTLGVMAAIVREDRVQPDLRRFVLREVIGGIRGHDFAGEMQRIFEYAQRRIVYRKDPVNVERVMDVWSTIYGSDGSAGDYYEPEGDCGVKSLFIASCAAILGHKPFFVVIKQRPNQAAFNHLYNAVLIDGNLKYYDATPEDRPAGWEAPSVEKFLVPIFN